MFLVISGLFILNIAPCSSSNAAARLEVSHSLLACLRKAVNSAGSFQPLVRAKSPSHMQQAHMAYKPHGSEKFRR